VKKARFKETMSRTINYDSTECTLATLSGF